MSDMVPALQALYLPVSGETDMHTWVAGASSSLWHIVGAQEIYVE